LQSRKIFLDALDANNDKMEKMYRQARKGKKNRTILTASLGAMTGLSPLVLPVDPAKGVTVVGGTSVLTLNSLEAGSVIGRNANEYQNKVKTNHDLRSQLQLKGNFFARKYALKSARRGAEFEQIAMTCQGLSTAMLFLRWTCLPLQWRRRLKKK